MSWELRRAHLPEPARRGAQFGDTSAGATGCHRVAGDSGNGESAGGAEEMRAIAEGTRWLLEDSKERERMAHTVNPYGDGGALRVG